MELDPEQAGGHTSCNAVGSTCTVVGAPVVCLCALPHSADVLSGGGLHAPRATSAPAADAGVDTDPDEGTGAGDNLQHPLHVWALCV